MPVIAVTDSFALITIGASDVLSIQNGVASLRRDFPECITGFGMLRLEHKTTTSAAGGRVLGAKAAEAIVREEKLTGRASEK